MVNKGKDSGTFQLRKMSPIDFILFSAVGNMMTNKTLSDPAVRNLLKSNKKFDLIIGECFLTEGLLGGFSYKYKAPMIGVATFIPNTWSNEMVRRRRRRNHCC